MIQLYFKKTAMNNLVSFFIISFVQLTIVFLQHILIILGWEVIAKIVITIFTEIPIYFRSNFFAKWKKKYFSQNISHKNISHKIIFFLQLIQFWQFSIKNYLNTETGPNLELQLKSKVSKVLIYLRKFIKNYKNFQVLRKTQTCKF